VRQDSLELVWRRVDDVGYGPWDSCLVEDHLQLAWLRAVDAHVRAGRTHREAARVQARTGHPELAALALARATEQREAYEHALAAHPEWAGHATVWPGG
jgi:hypothetical protein